jgi:hypothetical protein
VPGCRCRANPSFPRRKALAQGAGLGVVLVDSVDESSVSAIELFASAFSVNHWEIVNYLGIVALFLPHLAYAARGSRDGIAEASGSCWTKVSTRGRYPAGSSLLADGSQATASWRASHQVGMHGTTPGPPSCAALPNGNLFPRSALSAGPNVLLRVIFPQLSTLASRAMPPWLQIARQRAPAFALLGWHCVSSVQAANAWSTSCAHPSRRMRPVRGQLIGEWLWSLGFLMTGVPGRSRGVR